MNLQFDTSIPLLTVFLQGVLSFLSPCVLPLVPVYLGYLAGGGRTDEEGKIVYSKGKTFLNSLFFVLGISFTFFLLGFGFTALGQFFQGNRLLFARISGVIMILFGLYQMGAFGQSMALEREHRLHFSLDKWTMGPAVAFLLGFTFSFAWTPCVGPILGSVVLMAGTSGTMIKAAGLIAVYVLGFGIPFLLVGIFTGSILGFFQKRRGMLKYTVKIAALLMIFMGVMTFSGMFNNITGYISTKTEQSVKTEKESKQESESDQNKTEQGDSKQTSKVVPVPEFTLTDQNGVAHSISDYKGKVVFLNFWATWCPPCRAEMPDIQALYESYGKNEEDVVILGVAAPKYGQEGSQESIQSFLNENEYSYPVLMDEGGGTFQKFGISSFPTTYMIDEDGNIYGQVRGAMTADTMENIVKQTMDANK